MFHSRKLKNVKAKMIQFRKPVKKVFVICGLDLSKNLFC